MALSIRALVSLCGLPYFPFVGCPMFHNGALFSRNLEHPPSCNQYEWKSAKENCKLVDTGVLQGPEFRSVNSWSSLKGPIYRVLHKYPHSYGKMG